MKKLSENIRYLEKVFDLLNERYFENALSRPIITVQSSPKTNGHFTFEKVWTDNAESYHEINISAENINRPVQNVVATLLHEMVHLYCHQNGIKDTSRGGTYHNKVFKVEAEKRGLKIGYDKKIGYSQTEPGDELLSFLQEHKLGKGISYHRETIENAHSKAKKKSSTRKYSCPSCGTSVRATKEVHILCADCQMEMITDT